MDNILAGLVTVRQPAEKHFGGDPMLFNGKLIGKSEKPLTAAARWLLGNNAASEGDTIAVYRGETLSMHGIVGDLAKWTVRENAHGKPSLYLRPYAPFPAPPVGPSAAETADPVH